ncbi:hypothetical protein SPACI_045700 [Sporomusa acidovorans DSM 3132]|uniref:histidine kinase n=2 Tax=Sporomusa TaxID=2375 RepID=A0ABZ3J8H5_SPOA4|nr:blue-light-activated histidine kinase [Sporomusa acidovorans DSM 3132]SDE04345.1 PAS domain S-box-containing protein [Sporomusa acidovorans]
MKEQCELMRKDYLPKKKAYKEDRAPLLIIRLNREKKLTHITYIDPDINVLPQNMIGKNLEDFQLKLPNYEKFICRLEQVFVSGKKELLQVHTPNGCYDIMLLPERNNNQLVFSVLALVFTTTSNYQTDKQLSFFKSYFDTIQQIANIGYYEYDCVTSKFFFADQVYKNIGLPPQSIPLSLKSLLQYIHPEDWKLVETKLMQVPTAENSLSDFEFRAVKPDGSIVWLHTRSYPILDQDGRLLKKIGTIQDTTNKKILELELKDLTVQLKQINSSLKASLHNIRTAQKMAKLGYFEWDIVNKEIFWSEQQYKNFGFNPHAFIPSAALLRRRIHPNDIRVVKSVVHKLAKEASSELEFRVIKPDGSTGWLYARVKGVTDQQGHLVRLLGITQDITEKKAAEARIKKAEKELILLNQINTRSNYLNRLLVNDYPLEYTSKALGEFSIDSQSVYCCFVIRLLEKTTANSDITYESENISTVKRHVFIRLSDKGYDKIWSLNNNIIILAPVADDHLFSKQNQHAFAGQLACEIKEQFPAFHITIGISGRSGLPLNLKNVYEKAVHAAIVAADHPGRIIHFDDIGLYEIAFQLIKDQNIILCANNTIGRLIEYDQTHGGNLFLTLKCILEYDNLKAVAQKLYIHHNTAIWRKHRIEELLGMSLDKVENKVILLLHLKMWELKGKTDVS